MNFSGVYEKQGLKVALEQKITSSVNAVTEQENMAAKSVLTQLDCQDIPGTNCYCDSLAEEEIGKRIAPFGPEGLHFLDSGNYHYLTKLWLELVKEPFELLVFDHHTDMQRPAFGGILSCGGWIREALETNENLKHVILVGPPQSAMEETKKELLEDGEELIGKVTWISEEEFLQNVEKPSGIQKLCGQCKETAIGSDENASLPLYISIDKDVLSESEGKTNWDQGNVVLGQVLHFIDAYMQQVQGRQLIGVDVCGEDPETDSEEVQAVCRTASEKICRFIATLFKTPGTINADLMTDEQLHEKLQKGYDDMQAGRVQDAVSVFARYDKK